VVGVPDDADDEPGACGPLIAPDLPVVEKAAVGKAPAPLPDEEAALGVGPDQPIAARDPEPDCRHLEGMLALELDETGALLQPPEVEDEEDQSNSADDTEEKHSGIINRRPVTERTIAN